MENLKKVTALVQNILEGDVQARNSDSFLYLKVLERFDQHFGYDLHDMSIVSFLLNMKEMGVPPFESVRRARQKVQAAFPHLAACDKVAEMRGINETTYREYAREDLQ